MMSWERRFSMRSTLRKMTRNISPFMKRSLCWSLLERNCDTSSALGWPLKPEGRESRTWSFRWMGWRISLVKVKWDCRILKPGKSVPTEKMAAHKKYIWVVKQLSLKKVSDKFYCSENPSFLSIFSNGQKSVNPDWVRFNPTKSVRANHHGEWSSPSNALMVTISPGMILINFLTVISSSCVSFKAARAEGKPVPLPQ